MAFAPKEQLAKREEDLARVAWHPRGLVPIGLWVGMRLNELIIHG